MSRRSLKLVAVAATIGSVATAAAAGAVMPTAMVPWAIMVGTCTGWAAGLTVGRRFGPASGWSLWAWSTALAAAVATTGLIPYHSLEFLGAALLVSAAAILSAKAVSVGIDSRRDQH